MLVLGVELYMLLEGDGYNLLSCSIYASCSSILYIVVCISFLHS